MTIVLHPSATTAGSKRVDIDPSIPLVEMDRLCAGYGGAQILYEVSFCLTRGDRLALIGRNGVGKTTVVNALCGVARITSGSLKLSGQATSSPRPWTPARSGIAIVPQGRRILRNISVEENLLLGTAPARKGPWSLDAVYSLFPILKERRHGAGTALSGGQQQMLAVGRALMSNPSCLVLDEPSEGLAPVIVEKVADVIDQVAAHGTGILLIEQHLSLVLKCARRFAVLSKGAVVATGDLVGLSVSDLHHHIAV